MNYYNEIDPYCIAWLKNLIAAKLIPQGDVDGRRIEEVRPHELNGYTHCHFFAGIGGWAYAAKLAGWPDWKPLWTGSCPCQPFSVAGQGKGNSDPRHLWPHFHRIIREQRPPVVMGEQVAGAAGYDWFFGVRADLAKEGYGARAVDIPACSVNAPHIRNRLYWIAHPKATEWRVAHSAGGRLQQCDEDQRAVSEPDAHGAGSLRLAQPCGEGLEDRQRPSDTQAASLPIERLGSGSPGFWGDGWLENAMREGSPPEFQSEPDTLYSYDTVSPSGDRACPNFWDDWELIGPDPQGKFRRVKPGVRLVDVGIPARVSKLRSLGNSICIPQAAEVIKAYMEAYDVDL